MKRTQSPLKRGLSLFLLVLVLTSLVLVQAQDDTSKTEEDAQKVLEATEKFNPVGEDGEIDTSGYKPFKSKADERIGKINKWLEENVGWLKWVFGMTPEISWHFALTLWLILLGFLYFILKPQGWMSLFNLHGDKTVVIGIFLFLGFLGFGLFAIIAGWLLNVIAWAFGVAVAIGIIVLIVIVLLAIFAPVVLGRLYVWHKARKEAKAQADTNLNRQELQTEVQAIRQATDQ